MADSTLPPEVAAYFKKAAANPETAAALRSLLEPQAGSPDGPQNNYMLTEARAGTAVRDYIPPELADRFPDLAAGVGRPDFIPDEKWFAKQRRAKITRLQEEYGLGVDPSKPLPVKRKPKPYLNALTGEREEPKGEKRTEVVAQAVKPAKKKGPQKKAKPAKKEPIGGDTNNVVLEERAA